MDGSSSIQGSDGIDAVTVQPGKDKTRRGCGCGSQCAQAISAGDVA